MFILDYRHFLTDTTVYAHIVVHRIYFEMLWISARLMLSLFSFLNSSKRTEYPQKKWYKAPSNHALFIPQSKWHSRINQHKCMYRYICCCCSSSFISFSVFYFHKFVVNNSVHIEFMKRQMSHITSFLWTGTQMFAESCRYISYNFQPSFGCSSFYPLSFFNSSAYALTFPH